MLNKERYQKVTKQNLEKKIISDLKEKLNPKVRIDKTWPRP